MPRFAALQDEVSEPVALADVLAALGRELHQAAELALAAQEAASPLLAAVPHSVSVAASSGLQRLDLLAQRLEGLATFVKALGQGEVGAILIDAASATTDVLLADLAHRLCLSDVVHEVADGAFEMF